MPLGWILQRECFRRSQVFAGRGRALVHHDDRTRRLGLIARQAYPRLDPRHFDPEQDFGPGVISIISLNYRFATHDA